MSGTSSSLNDGQTAAVQPDGKVVVVGMIRQMGASFNSTQIAVRRYNANGTLDVGFGINGDSYLSLPSGTYNTAVVATPALIATNGEIVVAVALSQSAYSYSTGTTYKPFGTVVSRINIVGAVDSSFGTEGQTLISTDGAQLTDIAMQADGKIVLGGHAASTTGYDLLAVSRLNGDGSVDTTFNDGKLLKLARATYGGPYQAPASLAGLIVTPDQKIALATSYTPIGDNSMSNYEIAEFNADGTPNATFGTNGMVRGTATPFQALNFAALGPGSKFVIQGSDTQNNQYLMRLNSDGSVDGTFAISRLPVVPSSLIVQGDGKVVLGASTISHFIALRYSTAGVLDVTFGPNGQVAFAVGSPSADPIALDYAATNSLTVTPANQVILVGVLTEIYPAVGQLGQVSLHVSELVLAKLNARAPVSGDYDGDGRSDVAAELPLLGEFAIRPSAGSDVIQGFGPSALGAAIPAPGDYDGDGKTDVAAYLPQTGVLAYRPTMGGPDQYVSFGPAGASASIPAPGDYDGDGKTDVAVYIPSIGAFAVHPSSGVANYYVYFGTKGAGASIPVPGDYDGDGRTDLAVYLPATGTLAYRPSAGGVDVLTQFGPAGAGASIPVPGDYDGDGRPDIAVYIPASATFAIRPSSGAANYAVTFGVKGSYRTVPVPGDYDGDGKTDVAVYLPLQGQFAYRPSGGGNDIVEGFGVAGYGQTVPAASLPVAQPPSIYRGITTASSNAAVAATVAVPLTDDLIAILTGSPPTRKKAATLS